MITLVSTQSRHQVYGAGICSCGPHKSKNIVRGNSLWFPILHLSVTEKDEVQDCLKVFAEEF